MTSRSLLREDGRLHTWCKEGNLKRIEEFIYFDCTDLSLRLAYRRGVFGYTPLHEAVSNGHATVLQFLLNYGGDVNCRANNGYTPLHLAASHGHVDCVRVLLRNHADISITDDYGRTPMQTAKVTAKHAVIKLLKSDEFIKEARVHGSQFILKTPLDQLEENCLDHALLAAVESSNHGNVGKLILRGASNIDKALEESRRSRRHVITATLLMIKAAMENDRILVLKLYGEDVQDIHTKISITEEDNLAKLQSIVCGHTIKTVVPIEIARQSSAFQVREELLLRTDIDIEGGTVLWHGLHLIALEISWLQKIFWVKVLSLARNEFVSLPPEMGNYLKHCTKLDLQRNKIQEIPHCLLQLPSISEFNLSHNNIVNIPDAPEWSPSLMMLDLCYNHLRSLPNSTVAPYLKNLNISNNKFQTIPHCVCSFIGLTTLNIAHNPDILVLPSKLGRLRNLLNLNLDGLNNLIYPPRSVRVTTADCIRYLNSRFCSAYGFYHMELIVFGKCNSGKSTMVDRLCNKQSTNESTTGINVTEWKYAPSHGRKTFHFSFWDFASKEVYFSTPRYFLSKRSLHLLTWDITEGEKGVVDLEPWLKIISMQVPNSCLIIVGTFLDKISEEDRQSGKIDDLLTKVCELTTQYRHLAVTNITVVGLQGQMENVQKLKDYIYNAALEYKINNQYVMGAKIPSSYHTLFTKLHTIHHKVKNGEHKPIMHATEFKKMVRDLNLFDLQDDEELHTATGFLRRVGALLHYDDRKHNLHDLYFVNPSWLCDLVSTIVTAKERNFNMNGILRSNDISLLFKDKSLPTEYFQQCLTLLSKFEIILPLDRYNKRFLIPSLLPMARPAILSEQLPSDKYYYKRFIIFHSGYCHQTPPVLWSRLLSCIMNNIKEVKSILYEQIPHNEDDYSLIKDNGSLVYWSTGLFCNVRNSVFIVEALEETGKHPDRNGILIMCSATAAGCRLFSELIDLVEQMVSYQGLVCTHKVPCYECTASGVSSPYEFKVDKWALITNYKLSVDCSTCNKVLKLMYLVPDLFIADLDAAFLLDSNEVVYKIDKESLLETGAFGEVLHGKYKGQSVAVKLHHLEHFKAFRSESKVLQQLHHPCLVCMVGVTVHPTVSLVLEEVPQGKLQALLLKEQKAISRIVMYHIAIQVASALRFLHSFNILFYSLQADNVLLLSLSPDHLINCKVTGFHDPEGLYAVYDTRGFVAPEVAYVNHFKEHSVCEHRADIFSFGMFLYQLIARRHPFHNVQPSKIVASIEEGQRPQLEDIPVAETGLFYMTRVMKKCWAGNPNERPETQEIIEWLCAPALELIISIIPISSKYSVHNGCIVTPILSNDVGPASISSELWICSDRCEGFELDIFRTNTMVKIGKHIVKESQVFSMKQCGHHIWVASGAGLEYGVVYIFNKNTKDLVHNIKLRENIVSCITNSDQLVYMGTMEGYCFIFPMDVQTIQCDIQLKYKYVSEHCVDGVVLTKTCLWVSTSNQIYFLNPDSLDLEGLEKRTKNTQALVGLMKLSDNEDQVWSAHIGGMIMSSWNAHQRVHLCDFDVGVIAEEKCHVGDPSHQVITAMCTGLDTVWIGLASGHIIVFGMNPPGEVLTYFRPYHSYVRFLSSANYPGPCEEEKCMMLSGGKMYQPDNSFKKLPDFSRINENGQLVDTAGVVVLWEVLPAKYMQQVHYLSEGTCYLNYSRLEDTMIDTGFTESMNSVPPVAEQSNNQLINESNQLFRLLTKHCSKYLINHNENCFKVRKEQSTTEGVYEGTYKGQSVTIKLCNEWDKNCIITHLKKHFSEEGLLQQYHPCVAHLIGIFTSPTTSLVLDEVSLETLKSVSFRIIPRIVFYRMTIQITSAVSFLYNRDIIHFNLNMDNILLLSVSPDCFINCKVIVFNITSHVGYQELSNLQPFYGSTVIHLNCYNNFSKLLREFLTHQHMQQPMNLFHLNHIMKICCSWNCSLTSEHIGEYLSAPMHQLMMNVIPITGHQSISNGCIVPPSLIMHNKEKPFFIPGELWIFCDRGEGSELKIIKAKQVENTKTFNLNTKVCCMKRCVNFIWVSSQIDVIDSLVHIFDSLLQEPIIQIKAVKCIISCIANSDQMVYIGTEEGYCFAVPMDIQAIHSDIWSHHHKCVSEYCIDGVVLTQTHLWVSSCDQIYFLNPNSLEVEGVVKRTNNKHACVGKMMLCDNGDAVWSAHLGGVMMSSWNAHQHVHLCDVDVGVKAEEKCHVGDPRDQIITAMCTGLDTVWIGLASGHIIVFGMNPPGEVLTYFRPYHSYVRFLSSANYPGPCGKEECMMLSGGKMYQPDDSFKELHAKDQPVDTGGVTILWEVLPAKYVRQVHYLSDGQAWISYDRLRKAMEDTGFTESLKYCKSLADTILAQNETTENSTAVQQEDVCNQNVDVLHDDVTTLAHNDDTSQSEQLSVNLSTGEQLTITCEKPITIDSLTNKIVMETEMMGNMLITYKVDGEDIVTIKSKEQLEQYLLMQNRPNLCVKLISLAF